MLKPAESQEPPANAEGRYGGGRTKGEPAAAAAHRIFTSLCDLKEAAQANNGSFDLARRRRERSL